MAHFARVGALLRVHDLVKLERLLRAELLLAVRALEHGRRHVDKLLFVARDHLYFYGGSHNCGPLFLLAFQFPGVAGLGLARLAGDGPRGRRGVEPGGGQPPEDGVWPRRHGAQQRRLVVHLPVLVEALAAGQDQVAVRAGVGSCRAAQGARHARGLEQGGYALGVAGQDGRPTRQGQTVRSESQAINLGGLNKRSYPHFQTPPKTSH